MRLIACGEAINPGEYFIASRRLITSKFLEAMNRITSTALIGCVGLINVVWCGVGGIY